MVKIVKDVLKIYQKNGKLTTKVIYYLMSITLRTGSVYKNLKE